jgi:hypothetical protein
MELWGGASELCMERECKYGSMVYGMYLYVKDYKHGDDLNSDVTTDMFILYSNCRY